MKEGFETGDQVICSYAGEERTGTFITVRDGKTVIKLDNGYNIGIDPSFCTVTEHAMPRIQRTAEFPQDPLLPVLSIVSTGGTIASRIDYRTGAVTSQFDANDILTAIPGLSAIARYRTKQLYQILSENMTPLIWQELARAVHEEVRNGAEGVIVTHGTDTMSYTAAALSFMVQSPVPIILVGSQRSADRPSSDNVMNAECSAAAATSDLGEVAVVMHATTSDDRCAVHRATRVRKMHTSRRDAFQSIGIPPIGHVGYPSLKVSLRSAAVRRGTRDLVLADRLEEDCRLVYFVPGMPASILEPYQGCSGLVLAGTGLGHVSADWIGGLGDMVEEGTVIVMTSQCLHGRVCDRVYDTGRDLLKAGVIEGVDMLPEVALVKLMWLLGENDDSEEVSSLMGQDLRGECMRRSL